VIDRTVGDAWPDRCEQRAFVDGAAYGRYITTGFTPFPAERAAAESEAVRRYGEPSPRAPDEAALERMAEAVIATMTTRRGGVLILRSTDRAEIVAALRRAAGGGT